MQIPSICNLFFTFIFVTILLLISHISINYAKGYCFDILLQYWILLSIISKTTQGINDWLKISSS